MRHCLLLLLFWMVPALAANLDQLPDPRPAHRLLDQADMLTPDQEKVVEAALRRPSLETVEIVLVTVADVGEETAKNAAHRLFNRWKIGPRGDNGILILMVKGERRIEVEVGDGMERRIPDATVSRLLQEHAVPHFKQGAFHTGFVQLTDALAQAALAPPQAAPAKPPGEKPNRGWGLLIGGILAFVPLTWWVRRQTRRTRRNEMPAVHSRFRWRYGLALVPIWITAVVLEWGPWGWKFGVLLALLYTVWYVVWGILLAEEYERCPPHCACGLQTVLLTEAQEDAYLTQVQQLEETLKNVDHRVYLCLSCERTIQIPKVLKDGTKCPTCSHHTLELATRTIRLANTHATGLRQVTERCQAPGCTHKVVRDEVIPKQVSDTTHASSGWAASGSSSWDSGSSSSSSSSSSDSGSSSGGGAGADW